MITAPTSEVTPDRDLARLTILKPSEDISSAVDSEEKDVSQDSTGLGTVNGFPLYGPAAPDTQYSQSVNLEDTNSKEQSLSDDAASDITLRGDASSGSDQEDLENPTDVATSSKVSDLHKPDRLSPPSRPPPMPPRPKAQQVEKTTNFGQVENIAQQRDVTEVIGNVLYQLECAIVPQRALPDGEQWDLVKE